MGLQMKLADSTLTVTPLLQVEASFTVSSEMTRFPTGRALCLPHPHAFVSRCSQSLFCVNCVVFWDGLLHRALIQMFVLWLMLEEERALM